MKNHPNTFVLLLPIFGIGIFISLYVIATTYYPGGSWVDQGQNGFSFWNNYLCDLLDYYAINGDINIARFYARASLAFLCVSLIILWFYLPLLFLIKSVNLKLMSFSGILSLVITLFLASVSHDLIVRIAGVFGAIAIILLIVELHKIQFYKMLRLGVFCLIVFFLNYYIYETNLYIKMLPVIQKITFVSFISWFILLDISLYRKIKSQ